MRTSAIAVVPNEQTSRDAAMPLRVIVRPAHGRKGCIILLVNDNEQPLRVISHIVLIPCTLLFHIEMERLIEIAIVHRVVAPCDDVREINR